MTRAIRRDDLGHEQHLTPPLDGGLAKRAFGTFPASPLSKISPVQQAISPDPQNGLRLDDIHISVKTSKKFHRQRLDVILQTWFNQAKKQTFFITDDEDEEYQMKTDGHLINSNCSSSHHRKALCCKMSVELDVFLLRDKKWFCHFDDDNYVNVNSLLSLLSQYDEKLDWYLGKPSIKAPLELPYSKPLTSNDRKAIFWFATGGAGFCLSRSLVTKMEPLVSHGQFMSVGEKIRLPDDVTIGYVIEHLLHVPLTVVDKFHSHLEPLHMMTEDVLPAQISFSYSTYRGNQMNRVALSGWEEQADPTRFLSLYCHLAPDGHKNCPTVMVSPAPS
ncbi:Fringe glycosyltransferase [Hypsibius exemplaris]|uniref:Fringe glycosyltransferase n=1 Tax=Hypsibius exemplaris TaxID=2072580 RepID=A0A1W0X418_HYPEX|nr:Fringe glycosyltransferase [Hypsibius exemplaris]